MSPHDLDQEDVAMKNHGSSLTSVVLAVAAAVGVGVGGYYVMGGCSSCETEAAAADATAVSNETVDSCCAVEGEAAVETVALEATEDCCAVEGAEKAAKEDDCCAVEGEAQTVALEGEVCTDKADCDKATDCEDKTDCETECEDKAAEELTDAGADESSNG